MSCDAAGAPTGQGWGLREAVLGYLVAAFAQSIIGLAIIEALDADIDDPTGFGAYVGRIAAQVATDIEPSAPGLPLTLVAIIQIPLWIGLLGAPLWAVWSRGLSLVRDLGLSMRPGDVPTGLAIGIAAQVVLVPLLYVPLTPFLDTEAVSDAARELTVKATDPVGVVLLVLIVAAGAPFVEELFFRGLLLGALRRRFGRALAVVASSVVFGIIHLQPLQFPALVAFGFIAAALVERDGRLGRAIWAHVGFNATVVVVLLAA